MDHLPKQEAEHVIHMLTRLFLYAYQKRNKKMVITPENLEHLCHMGSKLAFQNEKTSTKIITQFLAETEDISDEERLIYEGFKGCHKQWLYMMQFQEEYTFVLDGNSKKVYGVRGISDSLAVTLRKPTAAGIIKAHYAILPYKDMFILDSLGMVSVISKLETVIDLYEQFIASVADSVPISRFDHVHFNPVKRDDAQPKDIVFSDFLTPLSYFFLEEKAKEEGIRLAMMAWNYSYEDGDAVREMVDAISYREYVKPLMNYRRKAFADVHFQIDHLEPQRVGKGGMTIVAKPKVEQTTFDI